MKDDKLLDEMENPPKPYVKGRRFIMKPVEHTPEPTDMLAQLQVIYSTQISVFSNKAKSTDGLSSQDITDLNKLVSSLAVINKEIRESREQGLLEGLSVEEQLELLQQAMDKLGIES